MKTTLSGVTILVPISDTLKCFGKQSLLMILYNVHSSMVWRRRLC